MARVRSGPSGKPVVMRDSAAGATIAAPAPCTTRAAISSTGSWARPPARLASANATKPIDEHAPPAEQVSGPAAEDQEAAERDGVSRHDPLDCIGGHLEFPLDRGQRDVHDAEIEDDHERGDENQGQLQRLAVRRVRRGGGRGLWWVADG